MKILLFTLVTIASCLANSPVRFDGFQVYRVTPRTIQQVETLKQIEENPMGYNFWTEVTGVGRAVDIMVPPHKKYDFLDLLDLQSLDAELWIENVQERVENERRNTPRISAEYDWKEYQTLDEINAWLDSLVEKHPGVVSSIIGGKSYEGREIKGVKVSYGEGKPIVFIESGIHAREWISPATITYILNELLNSDDAAVRALAESREWHIFPSVNPDGYVYTHTSNRMWRKTRKPYGTCYGADPNRNWGYHWMDGGSSTSPCSETHAGSEAFSEIETKSLSEYISSIAKDIEVYLAFHSYSQLLLIPFGHQGREKPSNNDEHHAIGKAAAESLAVRYGTRYIVGNIPEAIYVASGGSMDWALGVNRNIRLAYTYELRDTGRWGFLLPPDQIIPSGEETLDSVIRIFQELDKA